MAVAVVTGAGAGVGRAAIREFAANGFDVGLISRDPDRLRAASAEVEALGRRAYAVSADVADWDAIDGAAAQIEQALGPIDVWVNNAMVTLLAPVSQTTPEEARRGTDVTYLGSVHGMMAALNRMRPRNRGTIINVSSALAYRSIPLQAVYCGAKAAVRGFTESLLSELLHDKSRVHVCMVHLPAINTPQFDWASNKTGKRAQPVPPIYQPEVAARAILFAATHKRRDVWVGTSTVKAILASKIAPGLIDRYLAKSGYSGQMTMQALPPHRPANLFRPVEGGFAAHGRFDDQARDPRWEVVTDRQRDLAVAAGLLGVALLMRRALRRR